MRIRLLILLILSGIIFSSCNRSVQIPQIDREELFALDIGRLEDQIAMYRLEGDRGVMQIGMVMRDGFFFISDRNGGKIQRFNSYGNLLYMIYNDETNPPPMSLRPLQTENLVTRWSVSYPLQEPGAIAVDSRKHVYVRDRLPYERHSYDLQNRAYLDSIVLHFDAEGRFVEYLGRDGIGGSPFPAIEKIYISANDDLAVVCRISAGWDVYWFNSSGVFLFLIRIHNDTIPVPADRDMVIPSLESIAAAPDERRLYVKVDYYRDTYDESTNTRTGNEPDSSVVWIMDVETGAWIKNVEVPFYEITYTERNRRYTTRVFYSMIGVINNAKIFLLFPVEEGYSLMLLSSDSTFGSDYQQSMIVVNAEELHFNTFNLSEEGILSALLVDEWKVKLVWWRTDRISG